MTTLWHKDRLWPSETSRITGEPNSDAIPPGIYAENIPDWERIAKKGFRPGLDNIRKVGVSKEFGIPPAALKMRVATSDQLAWLKANEKVEIPASVEPVVRLAVVASGVGALMAARRS